MKVLFLVYRWSSSPSIFRWQREGFSALPLFIKTLIPFWELHLHDLIASLKPRLLIPSYLRLEFQHKNSGGHKHVVLDTHNATG